MRRPFIHYWHETSFAKCLIRKCVDHRSSSILTIDCAKISRVSLRVLTELCIHILTHSKHVAYILKQLPNWILPGSSGASWADPWIEDLIKCLYSFDSCKTINNYVVHANGMKADHKLLSIDSPLNMVIDFQDLLLFWNC